MEEQVRKIFIDDNILNWLEAELEALETGDQETLEMMRNNLISKREGLEDRIKRVLSGYDEGLYTVDETKMRRAEYQEQITEIEGELLALSTQDLDFDEKIEIGLTLITNLRDNWPDLDDEKRAEILGIITKKIVLNSDSKGSKILIEWEKPWDALTKINPDFIKQPMGSKPSNWYAQHDVFMNKMLTRKNEISCQLRQLWEWVA